MILDNSKPSYFLSLGWRPDGSFLQLKPSSDGKEVLVQSKPLLSEENSNPMSLLKSHQNHSTPEETEDEAPLYKLPKCSNIAIQAYIASSSSYARKSATQKAVSSSFSLMECLYGNDGATRYSITSSRRLEAVSNWLKGVVSDDVSNDIHLAKLKNDTYGSIFAALSGGDTAKASSLAFDSGHSHLSLMLASSGIATRNLFDSQLGMWNETHAQAFVPSGILRVFSLARGSLDTEESMFKADKESYTIDWRRRFGMYLWSCHTEEETTLSSLVMQYTSDVSQGIAPIPKPLYNIDEAKSHNCVLYEILRNYSDDKSSSLAGIAVPGSHTKFHHDYSASFHLAASMAAVTSSSLTLNQENLIIDAISSQLIMNGSWEWAVYATLCSIGNNTLQKSAIAARLLRAKEIILMFHTPSNSNVARRSFLEKLGVPSAWFSAAIAYRSANEGAVFTYVDQLMQFSINETLSAIENIIIPHYILGSNKSHDKLMHILRSVAMGFDESGNGLDQNHFCKAIYEFLCISKQVEQLCSLSIEDIDPNKIEQLMRDAVSLQSSLAGYSDACSEQSPLVKIPFEVALTPRYIYITEVNKMLTDLRLQLLSLKSGIPVETNISGLAFALNSGGLFGAEEAPAAGGSILRGICGYTS